MTAPLRDTGRPDLMLFANHGQALLVMQERHSRLLAAVRVPGKAAEPVAQALAGVLAAFPPHWRRTVAFDNGTEFARHYQLHELGVETFFCDARSPWQKGGVENRIGRLRRFLPRRTDLSALPDLRLAQLAEADNNTPRKCLGYLTPAEIYSNQVLHLKCESTFPLSRERRWRGIGNWECGVWNWFPATGGMTGGRSPLSRIESGRRSRSARGARPPLHVHVCGPFLLPIFRWGIDSSSSFALFCVRWSIWGSGRHGSQ